MTVFKRSKQQNKNKNKNKKQKQKQKQKQNKNKNKNKTNHFISSQPDPPSLSLHRIISSLSSHHYHLYCLIAAITHSHTCFVCFPSVVCLINLCLQKCQLPHGP